jgi:hypothetical protein
MQLNEDQKNNACCAYVFVDVRSTGFGPLLLVNVSEFSSKSQVNFQLYHLRGF